MSEFWKNIRMPSTTITLPEMGDLRSRSDEDLVGLARELAGQRRQVDAASALVAGELARRSERALGYDGLAQKLGARTPEKLVSKLTGVSVGEARSMVTVGSAPEWMRSVTEGVGIGAVGVATAAAIQIGLGEPNADIGVERLTAAAEQLAAGAPGMSPSEAGKEARFKRDELDAQGVIDRETAAREKRYLRMHDNPDGSMDLHAHFDPEQAVYVRDAIDRVTMPRRRGPRFLDPTERAREEAAEGDTRTIEQYMLDGLVQMVRLAAGVDDGAVFGTKSPAVRMHVTTQTMRDGQGAAYAEGSVAAFSMPTVMRLVCAGGVIPVLFDDTGQAVNVGREIRTYTPRQRIAIAARDGGCMIPGCDRPPSWTEVHHCEPWSEGGATDLCNGISLCRHHHMWLHNTGRWITYDNGVFVLHHPDGAPDEHLVSKHPLAGRRHHPPGPPPPDRAGTEVERVLVLST